MVREKHAGRYIYNVCVCVCRKNAENWTRLSTTYFLWLKLFDVYLHIIIIYVYTQRIHVQSKMIRSTRRHQSPLPVIAPSLSHSSLRLTRSLCPPTRRERRKNNNNIYNIIMYYRSNACIMFYAPAPRP